MLLVDGHDSGEDAEDGEYIAAGQRDGGQQVVQVIRGREGVRQLLNLKIIVLEYKRGSDIFQKS